MKQKHTYDLTASISPNLVVYPGDPNFTTDQVSSLEAGEKFNLCQMHLGNHAGTHIDFPCHTVKGGKSSNAFPLEYLIGPGVIIKVPSPNKSITKEFVAKQSIMKNDIVFFKTENSKKSKHDPFSDKYVYIEPDAAEELFEKGAKIVGTDYISVDRYDDEELSVHNILLSKETLIVEGLELKDIPEGRYEIFIMPLKVDDLDGLPARVAARPC